jgi:hypothetical protein
MNRIPKKLIARGIALAIALSFTLDVVARQKNDEIRVSAKRYLAKYEPQLRATTDKEARFYLLSEIAPAAFAAGEFEKAKTYSLNLLKEAALHKEDWNYGNAIHVADLVLGRIALVSGDVNRAKEHLLSAGRTPGSPQLDTFGPNMMLAKELLEKGERDVVIQYFELCSKFWQNHRGRLEQWKSIAQKGGVPDFRANLLYRLESWRLKQ